MNHTTKKPGIITRMRQNPDYLIYSQDTDTKIKLATAVYTQRKKMNLTQEELAKKIKTTQKVISYIESANVSIGIELLRRLVRELCIETETLGKIFGSPTAFNLQPYKGGTTITETTALVGQSHIVMSR